MYRFLCGLGVGGQFAVGVALVAEVVPARARPYALGTGAGGLGCRQHDGGRLPASCSGNMEQSGIDRRRLAVRCSCRRAARSPGIPRLQEAQRARTVAQSARRKEEDGLVSPSSSPIRAGGAIRSSACCSAFAGVVGLWGIGFFSYDLFRPVLEATSGAGLTGAALAGKVTTWIGVTSLFQNLGAFLGHLCIHLSDPLHGPQEGLRRQLSWPRWS